MKTIYFILILLVSVNYSFSQQRVEKETNNSQNIKAKKLGALPNSSKTIQEKTKSKVRVFVLAGQSNMEGFGSINDPENDPGSLIDVIQNDVDGNWSEIGDVGNWNSLEGASLYFANNGDTIRTNVTVGQGNNPNLIGAELMFAHQSFGRK